MLRKVSNFIIKRIKKEPKRHKINNKDISSIGKEKLYFKSRNLI
jgi:hypothetical protein